MARNFNHSVNRLVHWLLYLIAAILVFCAIVFTATRAMTPFLTMHKAKFENWASKAIGFPIRVSKVSFGWRGIEPEMWLKNAVVYTKDKQKKIVTLKSLYVSLDLFRTLFTKHISLGVITFSGAHLNIQQKNDGYTLNNALNIHIRPSMSSSLSDYIKALLKRSFISLQNVTINYVNLNKQKYTVKIDHVSVDGGDDNYQLYGSVYLEQKDSPAKIDFISDVRGDIFDFQHDNSKTYINFSNLKLASWLRKRRFKGYWLHSGLASGRLWMQFKQGKLTKASLVPKVYDFSLHSAITGKWLEIKSLTGAFSWVKNQQSTLVSVSNLNVISSTMIWPSINLYYKNNAKKNIKTIWLNYANITDLDRWLVGSGLISEKYRKMIAQYKISGALQNILIFLVGGNQNIYAQAYLNNIGIKNIAKMKSLKNISGSLVVLPNQGEFNINSQNAQLNFGKLFLQPLLFSSLIANVKWKIDKQTGVHIYANNFQVSNPDLTFYGSAASDIPFATNTTPSSPSLSLLAGFYFSSPTVAHKYFPTGIMHKGTVNWLDHAFIRGGAMQGKIIVHGPLHDFPYLDRGGIFKVDSTINNMELHYAKGWPNLTSVMGELSFVDNSMNVHVSSAKIAGAQVDSMNAMIPWLAGKVGDHLTVDTLVSQDASQIINLFKTSPLKTSVGKSVRNIALTGTTKTKLHLMIPFDTPDETKIKGSTNFNNGTLTLTNWQLSFKHLNGQINFTEKLLNATNLTATIWGSPVTMNIATQKQPYYATLVKLSSHVSVPNLFKYFHQRKPRFITGDFAYQAKLTLPNLSAPAVSNTLSIDTNLKGVAINLPAPFSKPAATALPANFTVKFTQKKPGNINFYLGHLVVGAFSFVPYLDGVKLYSGQINFGSQTAVAPVKRSLLVTGYLPQVQWPAWKAVIANFRAQKKQDVNNQPSLMKYNPKVNLHIGKLQFKKVTLNNIQIQVMRHLHSWQFMLDNKPMHGSIELPDNYPHSAITADFSRLDPSQFISSTSSKFDIDSLPWIHLHVRNFKYKKMNFDSVTLDLKPDGNILFINKLLLNSNIISCDLRGKSVLNENGKYHSSIHGSIASSDIHKLMQTLKINLSVIAKRFNANVEFNWPGFFNAVSVKNISGNANILLRDGWIIDLSKSTTQKLNLGKLLTLLSVSHLLTLHANDLGRDGYHFDTLRADLWFDHGIVTAKQLQALGTVADIKAKGRVNLIKRSLDLWLGIDTNLGASLPAIATIAGGPVIGPIAGFATWVVDKIIHSASRKYSRYGYHIVGSFSHPRVIKVKGH